MKDEVLEKIYGNNNYLEYLRRNPKWYYFLDLDTKNLKFFEEAAKKDLKITTYDKIENIKNQITFASSIINYFTK